MPPQGKNNRKTEAKVDWSIWQPLITIVGCAVAIIAVTNNSSQKLSDRIGTVETSMANLNGSLENLNGRLEPIFNQYYGLFKRLAVEKGFDEKNVEFMRVSLSKSQHQQTGPILFVFKGSNDKTSWNITYTLVEITPNTLFFEVNGKVGGAIVKDVRQGVPLVLNMPVSISLIGGPNNPKFFIEVIALRSKEIGDDTAILAAGPKSSKI